MNNELLNLLLENRGLKTEGEKEKFLNLSYDKDLHDPYLMKDMEKACVRVFEAVDRGEKIVIYGDYDCDGIPGSVILHDLLKKIGYNNFSVYIPDRHSEGFGLHQEAIEKFCDDDVNLIITVDLGITDISEVALAQGFGIDVIITDHHLPKLASACENFSSCALPEVPGGTLGDKNFHKPSLLPRAYAILNPKVDEYPEKMLCGSGVVFKFVQAFVAKYGEYFERTSPSTALRAPRITAGWEKWLLDMVGLATLSDMVPLRGENRALAYYGLKVLQKNRRLGLGKIFQKLNIDPRYLSEDDITFMIAPRLNAAGRMDSPRRAFELLTSEDEGEAGALAEHLAKINDERKALVATTIKEIKRTLEKRERQDIIVLGNPKWRVGILGLIASKIVEEYERPAFVWGREGGEIIKGSCRSDGSVNLVKMMSLVKKDSLLDFGGHELAGGFSVSNEQVYFLEERLSEAFSKVKRGNTTPSNSPLSGGETTTSPDKGRQEGFDMKLGLSDVSMKNWREIERLAPFGLANPKPVFLFENIEIKDVKKFGKEKNHLEISFSKENGQQIRAIAFFTEPEKFKVVPEKNKKINLIANFEKSFFRNRFELRLRIVDIP